MLQESSDLSNRGEAPGRKGEARDLSGKCQRLRGILPGARTTDLRSGRCRTRTGHGDIHRRERGGRSVLGAEKGQAAVLVSAFPGCQYLKLRVDQPLTWDIVYDANTSLRVTSRYPWDCSSSMILGRASAVSWAPTCNTTIAPLHAPSTAYLSTSSGGVGGISQSQT